MKHITLLCRAVPSLSFNKFMREFTSQYISFSFMDITIISTPELFATVLIYLKICQLFVNSRDL